MSDLVEVAELIRREDGSVCGLGGSDLVLQAEAEKLIAAGTHKLLSGALESSKKKKAAAAANVGED